MCTFIFTFFLNPTETIEKKYKKIYKHKCMKKKTREKIATNFWKMAGSRCTYGN